MKQSKFTEVQIIKILSEQNAGKSVNDICREHGISQGTFYNWKSKYGGMEAHQLAQLKELEKQLSQYKKIVAELTLENVVLKDVIEKSFDALRKAGSGVVFKRNSSDEFSQGVSGFQSTNFCFLLQENT